MADYRIEVVDESLKKLFDVDGATAAAPGGETITRIAGGFKFTEGPLWMGDHLLFSDIPNSRIVRWKELPEGPEITTFRTPSGNSNGLTLDRTGRILACEHSTRRVTRLEADGSLSFVAESYEGKRLNSPNDVVVRSDGAIFFTDPPYGLRNHTEGKELPYNGVFRIGKDGSMALLADDFERPNGLAFSPDESLLYVDDTSRHHIRVFKVDSLGNVSGGEVFAELRSAEAGGPDGLKVDSQGNIYSTGSGGIWVFSKEGKHLGRIVFPELPANLAWGGADWKTLYATARSSVYRMRVFVAGIPVGVRV